MKTRKTKKKRQGRRAGKSGRRRRSPFQASYVAGGRLQSIELSKPPSIFGSINVFHCLALCFLSVVFFPSHIFI